MRTADYNANTRMTGPTSVELDPLKTPLSSRLFGLGLNDHGELGFVKLELQ